MAGGYLSKLVVSLEASTAKFEGDMGRAAHMSEKHMRRISSAVDSAGTMVKALGSAFVVSQVVGFAKGIVDSADKLQDMSNRTGIAVKDLAALDYVASQTGASTEALAKGMRTLDSTIAEMAAGGAKDMQKLFSQLGLDDLASGAVTGTDALLRLAEVFPKLNDAQRQFVSAKLGKSFHELIPALAGGRAEMEKMLSVGKDLAGDITALAKESNIFNDNIDRLSRGLKSSLYPALNNLLPIMNSFAEGMGAMQKAGMGFWESLRTSALAVGKDAGKSVSEYTGNLVALKKTLAEMEAMPKWKQQFVDGDIAILKTQISLNEKQLVLAKSMQATQALAGAGDVYSNEGRIGSSGPIKLDVSDGKPAKAIKAAKVGISDLAKETSNANKLIKELQTSLDQVGMDDFAKETMSVNARIDEFTHLSASARDSLKAQSLAIRTNTMEMEGAAKMEEEYFKQKAELAKSNVEFVDNLIAQGDESKKLGAEVARLGELWESGAISAEIYHEAIKGTEAYKQAAENAKKGADEVSGYWEEATKSIQNSLSDFLVEAMNGNWKSIGAGFEKMLQKMAADAIAAHLMELIVGKPGAGGKGASGGGGFGGLIGTALSWWAGAGAKAGGGSVAGGQSYMVGERGPEMFSPAVAGTITPNKSMGGQSVVQNFTIAQPASRETQSQVAAAAQTGLMRAARRNN